MEDMTIDDYIAMEEEQMMEEPDWEEEAAFAAPAAQSPEKLVNHAKQATASMPSQADNQLSNKVLALESRRYELGYAL